VIAAVCTCKATLAGVQWGWLLAAVVGIGTLVIPATLRGRRRRAGEADEAAESGTREA
jgi:hypothetical protein